MSEKKWQLSEEMKQLLLEEDDPLIIAMVCTTYRVDRYGTPHDELRGRS